VGLTAVVLFHLLLIWVINSGLARQFVKVIKGPVETKLIEDVKPDIPPPPPPPPPPQTKAAPPPPPEFVPVANIQTNAPASTNAIAAVTNVPVPVAPPPPVVQAPVVHVPAVINAAANCRKPEYPSSSRRNEEEGTVQLRFLVGTDGLVVESKVEGSSGFATLDEAARAALSKCQFKPGTANGAPEQSWASMKYTWRLE
jgi:protein TonB